MAYLKFALGSSVRCLREADDVGSATKLQEQVQWDVHGVGNWESLLSIAPEAVNTAVV